jgi:acyl-CoA synthetase (NDP forming)
MPPSPENIQRLLNPRHIAFIGGSDAAFSAKQCARHFDGPVWGVNPKRKSLGGVPCFATVADLPEAPDAVFLATPRKVTADMLRQLNRVGAGGVACFTAGYGELGESGQQAEKELVEAAGNLALVGPNCYGLINYTNGATLWPFGAGDMRCEKGIALIMQSGMIPANMTMNQRSVPISYVISAGNQAVLAIEDYIDVLADDPRVTAIGLYIEGIKNIEKFADAAIKALRAEKPIIVLKAGSSRLASQLTVSHTGSLAGLDQAYQALFHQLGIIRVDAPMEMMETLKFLSVSGAPGGRKIAAFTCSGGEAALVADYCEKLGLELPQPTDTARKDLTELLPDIATVSNPLDYTTPLWGNTKVMPKVFQTLIADGFDAALVIQDFPPSHIHEDNTPYRNDARSFMQACNALDIPGAVCSDLPENIDRESREMMITKGITPLQGIDCGLQALSNACRYGVNREQILKCGKLPDFSLIRVPRANRKTSIVDEWLGKQRLARCGVEIPSGQLVDATGLDDIVDRLSYPVVVKAVTPELPHKSEAGAVKTGLHDAAAVKVAVAAIQDSVSRLKPRIKLDNFLIESMVEDVIAELMVGISTDPQFGQMLVIASGGLLVELIRDSTTLLLPTSDGEIDNAIRSLKCFKLLNGFRGKPKVDIRLIVDTIRSVINLAETHCDRLVEMDINPLMVTRQNCIAADVMIREVAPKY